MENIMKYNAMSGKITLQLSQFAARGSGSPVKLDKELTHKSLNVSLHHEQLIAKTGPCSITVFFF